MTTHRSVLISGAGIAGLTVAACLHRQGWDVTVVERASALRTAGQNIDVRGAGRQVARHLGIEDRIAGAGTGEAGTRFVDDRGRTIAAFPAGTGDSDGVTAELEILRGQLVGLLAELTAGRAELLLGEQIEGVRQDDDAVTVTLGGAPPRRFDLLVVAEGIRSRTRRTVFGDEVRVRDLGQYTAYGTIPRTADDDAWWRWHSAPGGRAVTLRPDNVGTTRAALFWLGPPRGYESLDAARQVEVLRRTYAGIGWQTPRILDALAADPSDFYLDRVGQVHAPAWSHGRVVLVGDAAYCASPISGMGTSLSLTGAYLLAGELAARDDHRAALRAYESLMRPYVTKAQKLAPGAPRLANPTSRLGVHILNGVLRVAASRPVQALTGRVFSPPAGDIALPEYAGLRG